MKRYISTLIALILVFSLTACSNSGGSTSSAASSTASQEVTGDTSSGTAIPDSGIVSDDSSLTQSTGSAVSAASSVSKAPAKTTSQAASQPAPPTTVRVVIPEGFTLSQIGDRLEAKGVCKKADLLKAANSYDFSYYSLIGKLSSNANRAFKLEGYLFPDTYDFYLNMKPQDALGKMLRDSESKISTRYSYSGMTTDQLVTLASMIEKEADNTTEMKKISSVFHNRLKAGMKLQADPTIIYIESYVKPNLTGDINRYNSYYNTYKCPALPAGAICNPGQAALDAAAHPADTNYLYFAADKSGNYYYAATYDEHKANLAKGGIIEGGGMQ